MGDASVHEVQLVQVETIEAEVTEARLARAPEPFGSAVGLPLVRAVAAEAALRGDQETVVGVQCLA